MLGGCLRLIVDSRQIRRVTHLQLALNAAMQSLMNALAQIAKESGHGSAAARSKAEEAIVRLEGSLILARVLGDTACFERALKAPPDMLTVP